MDHAMPTRRAGYFAVLLLAGVGLSIGGAVIGAMAGTALFRFGAGLGLQVADYFYQFFPFIGGLAGWLAGGILVVRLSVRQVGQFVGGHALVSFLMFFLPIFAANGLLATNAVSTFPGLVVKNGYIASQGFDRRRAAQQALGWTVSVAHDAGNLRLAVTDATGRPVEVASLTATIGRATTQAQDIAPVWAFDGVAYVAPVTLGLGNWQVRIKANSPDGTLFEQTRDIFIKG
jgi:nitrogen fixation protein FixH